MANVLGDGQTNHPAVFGFSIQLRQRRYVFGSPFALASRNSQFGGLIGQQFSGHWGLTTLCEPYSVFSFATQQSPAP